MTPEPAAQRILPQPLAQSFETTTATTSDGKQIVVLTIYGVCGQWVTFLDPPTAKAIAAQIEQAAARALSSLIIAGSGDMP